MPNHDVNVFDGVRDSNSAPYTQTDLENDSDNDKIKFSLGGTYSESDTVSMYFGGLFSDQKLQLDPTEGDFTATGDEIEVEAVLLRELYAHFKSGEASAPAPAPASAPASAPAPAGDSTVSIEALERLMEANWRSENPPKYIKASDLVRDYDGNYYIHAKKLEAFEAKPSDVDDDFEGANYILEEIEIYPNKSSFASSLQGGASGAVSALESAPEKLTSLPNVFSGLIDAVETAYDSKKAAQRTKLDTFTAGYAPVTVTSKRIFSYTLGDTSTLDWNETYFRIDDFDTFTGVAVQKTAIVSEMDTADTAIDTSLVKYKGIDYLADVDKAEVEILKAARKKLRDCFDNGELVEKGDFVNMIVAEQKINSMVEIRGAAFDDFKLHLTKATVDDELSEQIKGVTTKDLYKMVEETKLFDRAYGPIKKFEKVETPKTDELRANMLEKIDAMRDNYGGVVKLKTLEHQEVVEEILFKSIE